MTVPFFETKDFHHGLLEAPLKVVTKSLIGNELANGPCSARLAKAYFRLRGRSSPTACPLTLMSFRSRSNSFSERRGSALNSSAFLKGPLRSRIRTIISARERPMPGSCSS